MADAQKNPYAEMSNEQIIDLFLEDILASIGLNQAPEADKTEFKSKLKTELEARVGVVVMNSIPEDKAQEFVDLMKTEPDQTQINDFVSKHVTNLEELIVQAMKDFKEEFIKEFEKNLKAQQETAENEKKSA